MNIKKIKATNIKGRDFEIKPKPLTLISGSNMSGKSAVRIAIELGFLGYTSGIGKTPSAIMQLCGDSEDFMQVDIELDNHQTVRRQWSYDKNGRARTQKSEPFEIPPVMFDLEKLFGMTKAARLQYLFDQCEAGKNLSWPNILKRVKGIKIEPEDEISDEALDNIVNVVKEAEGETVPDQLAKAIELVKLRLKTVSAEVKDHDGFIRTQTRSVDFSAPVTQAQSSLQESRDDLVDAKVELANHESAIERYESIKKELLLIDINSEQPADWAKQALEATENISRLQGMLSDKDDRVEEYFSITRKVDSASNKLSQVEDQLLLAGRQLEDLDSQIESVNKADCCPACKANGTKWRDELISELTKQKRKKEKEIKLLESKRCEVSGVLKDRIAKQGAAKSAVDKDKDLVIEKAGWEYRKNAVDREISLIERDSQLAANLKKQISQFNEDELADKLSVLKNKVFNCEQVVNSAESNLRLETTKQAEEIAKLESLQRREVASSEVIACKAIIAELQAIQKEELVNAFEPLLGVIRQFTDGLIQEPLAFHEAELGYWKNGVFVSRNVFSGSEEALALTGLMIALASTSQSPVKIAIIDEMGRFDPVHLRPKVIDRMIELTGNGVIDHFFGLDPDVLFCAEIEKSRGESVLVHCT